MSDIKETGGSKMTDADRAAIYLMELVTGLDKRTKNYRRALEAQSLVMEIRRSEATKREETK